jgi:hypothetical protein
MMPILVRTRCHDARRLASSCSYLVCPPRRLRDRLIRGRDLRRGGATVEERARFCREGAVVSGESAEALEVLRVIWRNNGHNAAELDAETGATKSCKRMADAGVGFEDFAAGEADLNAAWRARLEREGKLAESGGGIRDLVMGPERTTSS